MIIIIIIDVYRIHHHIITYHHMTFLFNAASIICVPFWRFVSFLSVLIVLACYPFPVVVMSGASLPGTCRFRRRGEWRRQDIRWLDVIRSIDLRSLPTTGTWPTSAMDTWVVTHSWWSITCLLVLTLSLSDLLDGLRAVTLLGCDVRRGLPWPRLHRNFSNINGTCHAFFTAELPYMIRRSPLITLPFPLKTSGFLVFRVVFFFPYQYKCVFCNRCSTFPPRYGPKASSLSNAWVAPKYGF